MTAKNLIVSLSAILAVVVTVIAILCNWNGKKERKQRISVIAMSFVGISISIVGIHYIGNQFIHIDTAIGSIGNAEAIYIDEYVESQKIYQGNVEGEGKTEKHFAFVSVKNLSSNGAWIKRVKANPGDIASIRVEYFNMNDDVAKDVVCRFVLPDYLEYIPDSLILYAGKGSAGIVLNEEELGDINIGDYSPDATGIVVFNVLVKQDDYGVGKNVLRSWIQVYEDEDRFTQDFSDICIYIDE